MFICFNLFRIKNDITHHMLPDLHVHLSLLMTLLAAFIFSLCIFISKERNLLEWLILYDL